MTSAQHRALLLALLLATGIVTSTQMGKVVPLLHEFRTEFDAPPAALGWLSSMFSIVGACGGVLLGMTVDRLGHARSLTAGLALLGVGALAGVFAGSFPALFASRAVEGCAYLLVSVAIPAVIARVAQGTEVRTALAVWGCVVPLGITVAMLAAPPLAAAQGWRGVWGWSAALFLITALLWWTMFRRTNSAHVPLAVKRQPAAFPWAATRLALVFLLYSAVWFCLVTWVPYIIERHDTPAPVLPAVAGAWVAGANIAGNLLGTRLLMRGHDARRLMVLSFSGLAAACAVMALAEEWPLLLVVFGTIASFVAGAIPPAVMLGAKDVAGDASRLGSANAIIIQGAHIGALLAPPAFGWIISAAGHTLPFVLLVAAAAAGACVARSVQLRS